MDFSRAVSTYRKNALVQKLMSKKLVSCISDCFGKKFEKILEIGSGTGFLTDLITADFEYKELTLNDLTDNYTSCMDCTYIKGDASVVELPQGCELVISNAVFQWIENPGVFFKKLKTSLCNKSLLAFSSFGNQNYKQFKEISAMGLIYPEYVSVLEHSGYEIVHFEEELDTIYFKTPREVLRHIKTTGVALSNSIVWNKSRLKTFEDNYIKCFGDKNGVELTYHPVYILARSK